MRSDHVSARASAWPWRLGLGLLACSWLWLLSVPAAAQLVAGTRPASTNVRAAACPCIHSDLRVTLAVRAPGAQQVQVELPGKRYDLVRDTSGTWTVTTEPLVPGFHYYSLVIDGARVADPASQSYFGTGRMSSAVEIPEAGVDFYTVKDVPVRRSDVRLRGALFYFLTSGVMTL